MIADERNDYRRGRLRELRKAVILANAKRRTKEAKHAHS